MQWIQYTCAKKHEYSSEARATTIYVLSSFEVCLRTNDIITNDTRKRDICNDL